MELNFIDVMLQMQVITNLEKQAKENLDLAGVETLCCNLLDFIAEQSGRDVNDVAHYLGTMCTKTNDELEEMVVEGGVKLCL